MSSMFNFGSEDFNDGGSSLLAGNKIHTVKFKGLKYETLEGKNGMKYNVIKIKFEGAGGAVFEDTVFEPTRKEDAVRQKNDKGWENPSVVETITAKLRLVLKYANPTKYQELASGKAAFAPKDFKELATVMERLVAPGIDKEVKIKLLKKAKDGYAQFPMGFLTITKKGGLWVKNPFIAGVDEELNFTEYELERIAKSENDTPTQMKDSHEEIGVLSGSEVEALSNNRKSDEDLLDDVNFGVLG